MRTAFVHNTVAPYRHILFERLSRKLDLVVYYCSLRQSFRKWDLWPRKYDYEYRVLQRIPVGNVCLNPSVITKLIADRPDLLVLCGYTEPTMWLSLAVAKLLNIHLVYWTEGVREPRSILGVGARPLRTVFTKRSRAIVVPGRLSRDYVMRLGAEDQKVFIVPNAIDNELFIEPSRKFEPIKEKLKNQLGLEGKAIILCVSQFIERKGIKFLLYAYEMLKRKRDDIALLLIGDGPLESELRNIADRLKLKDIRFLHSGLCLSDLIKLYSSADIFVQPTLEDLWGFVINEAMACGLPVVATRASQAAVEMIRQGKNGFIVKEANVKELYDALDMLLCEPKLVEKMGKSSRETVMRTFNVEFMVDGFLKAIDYSKRLPP